MNFMDSFMNVTMGIIMYSFLALGTVSTYYTLWFNIKIRGHKCNNFLDYYNLFYDSVYIQTKRIKATKSNEVSHAKKINFLNRILDIYSVIGLIFVGIFLWWMLFDFK